MDEDEENLKYRLKEFKDRLLNAFDLHEIEERVWNRKIADFLQKIR